MVTTEATLNEFVKEDDQRASKRQRLSINDDMLSDLKLNSQLPLTFESSLAWSGNSLIWKYVRTALQDCKELQQICEQLNFTAPEDVSDAYGILSFIKPRYTMNQQMNCFKVIWNTLINGHGVDPSLLQNNHNSNATHLSNSISLHVVFLKGATVSSAIASVLTKKLNSMQFSKNCIIQSFRVLLTFFLMITKSRSTPLITFTICGILDICLLMMPAIWDFSNYLDLVSEFSKLMTLSSLPNLISFLASRKSFFLKEYRRLDCATAGDKKKMQTSGAKFVGLIKAIEERLSGTTEISQILTLRRLLIECLPLTHAGVTNKLSAHVAEPIEINPEPQSVWRDYAQWETSEDTDTAEIRHAKKSESSKNTIYVCPYAVYDSYCQLQPFLQNPQMIKDEEFDTLKKIQEKLSHIMRHFSKSKPTLRYYWGDCDVPTSIQAISSCASFREAVDEICFRKEFLSLCLLAIQTLTVPHKKEAATDAPSIGSSIIDKMDEKSVKIISNMYYQIWYAVQDIMGFEKEIKQLLTQEKLWISWKQSGCPDNVMHPIHNDTLPPFSPKEKSTYSHFPSQKSSQFINFLKLWDNPSISNAIEIIPQQPTFNREAKDWFFQTNNLPVDQEKKCVGEKLIEKLEQCRTKINEDDKPENEVEESEKSKHDPLFRFRFSRLFALQYLDAYMELSNNDTIDGKLDALVHMMNKSMNQSSKEMAGSRTKKKT